MISIPFFKKMGKKDCIGLDWGIKQLKWVKLQTITPDRYKLSFLDCFELPDNETQIVPDLKEYVLKQGMVGTPIAVSLQDTSLHIRRIELPKMPPEDLKEAVRWQMRDIAEDSMDDYTVRYSIIEETALTDIVRLTLLGYAIKKKVILNQTRSLRAVGLKPVFLEPTPVSLAYAVERIYPTVENEWIGCLDIGWKQTYLMVIGQGKLHFVRSLTGIAMEQALELKEQYATKLALEIQHAMDAFSIAYHDKKISKIFLAGGGAGFENLSATLTKNLGIQTEILNPLQGIEQTAQFPLAAQKPHLFGAALGLAFLRL